MPRPLRAGPCTSGRLCGRVHARPDPRARARLLHAYDVRVRRRGDRCPELDLRRWPVRRADPADRGAADPRNRLRRGDRAAASVNGGRRRASRAPRPRRRRRAGRGRQQSARPPTRRRAAPSGAAHGGRLRGPLAEGPAHARAQARRAGRRRVGPGALDDPPLRGARRRGRDCRTGRKAQNVTWRDLGAGDLRRGHVGERHTLAGWVARRRDHGGLVFVDLRDASGVCQLVINPERAAEAAGPAHQVRNEFVLQAEGEVVARAPENVNPGLPTGEVELQVDQLEILSRCPPLPFQLDEEGVDETLRLRYRWLDLRRPRLQRNLRLRAQMVSTIRRVMEHAGFLEIETPILFKPTPEGARDFIVPSRLQPGRFFALPQSPQILKQLLVIGGFDRYYQIAICFRDEDLRADRVQEITQLDVELAFPDQQELFPLVTAEEAQRRYGSDKPDLTFELEIQDATEATRGSQFGVFAGAECVRFLTVPQAFSRAELARLEEVAKEWGAKGLAYLVYDEEGQVRSPIAKFLSEPELAAFRADAGSTVLFAADAPALVSRVLGALRLHLGRELGLIDP